MKKTAYLHHAALYAVIGLSLLTLAALGGKTYIAQQSKALVGVDQPISVTASNFKGNPNGSYAGTVWDPDGTNTAKALAHQGIVVFYKNTSPSGDYYQTANMGSDSTLYKTVHSSEVVHCSSSATVEGSHNSHLAYSPNISGMYDGPGHYWCSMNGTAVDPLPGPESGKMMPDLHDKTAVLRITLPDGTNYHKSASTGQWVQCTSYAGPYRESDISGYSSDESSKNIHWHCLSFEGGYFVEPESGSAPPSPYTSIYMGYSSSTCPAGDTNCGGAGTYGTGICSRGTYFCQTTDPNVRYCSANSYCLPENFTPPGPTWTIGTPTNLRITGTKATGFMSTESVPVAVDFAATGTGIPYGQATLTVQIAQDTTFASAWTRPSSTGSVTAIGSTVLGYITDFPATGTFYWRAKMSLGTQESAWTSAPYGSFVVCAAGKTWNGTACATPTVSTCTLGLTLNDGKTTYSQSQNEFVNYTYSCSPAGTTAASVTVQVVKPDGTATTYNTGTNIATSTMGFSTSNLAAGTYTLRACLNATCTSGVASVNFTVAAAATTTTTTTTTPTTTTTTTTPTTTTTTTTPATTATTATNGTTTTVTVEAPKACSIGGKCVSGSWCNNGRQCYYPDGSITCASWNSNTCPAGTKLCSPTDTNCIEPGTWGSLNGWCMQGMECYSADGSKKWCEPYGNTPAAAATTCPAGTKLCGLNDTKCIEPGATGPSDGWCKNSMECFVDGKKFCQPMSSDPMAGQPACPSGSKLCSPTDTNCIEPGSTGSVSGWCKNAMECYSADGTQKFCQAWENTTGTVAAGAYTAAMPAASQKCPAAYPKQCRPDDRNCIELGATGPADGWCTSGGKQCFVTGGLYCAGFNETCPAGASACRATDINCIEPGKYGKNDGWCGGNNVAPCYKNDGTGMYCVEFVNTGPSAWEKAVCPSGTSRCRADDKFCLELGETGPASSWCGVGMMQWNDDGTVTCVSSEQLVNGAATAIPVVEPQKEETPEFCIQVLVTASNPATGECRVFATPCKVPKGWTQLTADQVCKDGKVGTFLDSQNDQDSVLRTLEEDMQYLKDLKFQLRKVSVSLTGVNELTVLIDETLTKAANLKDRAKKDFAKNKKVIQDELSTLHKVTLASIDEKFAAIQPYLEFLSWKDSFQGTLDGYKNELRRAEKGSEYEASLSSGIEKLEGLFKSAEGQRGEALDRIFAVIKSVHEELDALINSQHNAATENFLGNTLNELENSLAKFNAAAESGKVARHTLFMLSKFEGLLEQLRNLYEGGGSNNEIHRLLDESLKMRETLAEILKLKAETATAGSELEGMLKTRFDDAFVNNLVEKVFDKVSNKLTVMLDETMQKIAIKITEMTSVATDKLTQSLSNLTSVVEEHRQQIVEAKNNILERVQKMEELAAAANLKASTAKKLKEVMDLSATINWCGINGDTMQAKINSASLALEAYELTAAEIDALYAEVSSLAEKNNDVCYMIGASNFRDTPMHLWYFEPAQYNSTAGYIKGYSDASGNPTGNFGPSDSTLRIEALAMAMRMFGVPAGTAGAVPAGFVGVPAWGTSYVNGALGHGFDLRTDVDWAQPVTRAESAELFANIGRDNITLPTSVTYADDYKDYAEFSGNPAQALAVDALTELSVFQGYQGNFNPNASLLRSEFATVNMRLVENLGLAEGDSQFWQGQ